MRYLPFILLTILWMKCAKLDIHDIHHSKSVSFDGMLLKPDHEPNDLRIDVVRQKTTSNSTDAEGHTTISESNVDYHPMGFDLSNGLFYDLHGNLSLRIDKLLNVKEGSAFEIRNSSGRKMNRPYRLYSFERDTFRQKSSRNNKAKYMVLRHI